MAKSLEQQLTCAQERARKAHITVACIGFDGNGFRAHVTSESDPTTEYTIRRNTDGNLQCNCVAGQNHLICKHLGAVMLENVDYHSNAKRPEDVPVTPNPNRDPEPEPPAPSPVLASALATMPSQQTCTCCGETWHVKALAHHYICPRCTRTDREQLEGYWHHFPLLMDVAAEVAVAEDRMQAEGFYWSELASTWVRKPTMAERAAAALLADHTPEGEVSIFVEVAR